MGINQNTTTQQQHNTNPMEHPKSNEGWPCIGIDLGTTYSCVSVMHNGEVTIIENELGARTTPSYVGFTEKATKIGAPAKNQAARNPKNTVFDAKRLIGRKVTDPTVVKDMKLWPFDVKGGLN